MTSIPGWRDDLWHVCSVCGYGTKKSHDNHWGDKTRNCPRCGWYHDSQEERDKRAHEAGPELLDVVRRMRRCIEELLPYVDFSLGAEALAEINGYDGKEDVDRIIKRVTEPTEADWLPYKTHCAIKLLKKLDVKVDPKIAPTVAIALVEQARYSWNPFLKKWEPRTLVI